MRAHIDRLIAMDERRPRRVEQERVPPGPLADLKALLYELYTDANYPQLTEIAKWVKADTDLPGAPGRDTIHRLLREAQVPSSQADVVAVVTVLARAARWEPGHTADQARDLWFAARTAKPVGISLEQVTDPFALEIHKPIQLTNHTTGDPVLPIYVPRAHDARLAEVVNRALEGENVMAVLVAGSSAGKTRACWEALHRLRRASGWRLWHPYHPSRVEAVLAKLDQVRPRTVVWLNETQNYLGGPQGELVAAGLRSLLTDRARAPVLVLGTLWPGYYTDLTHDSGSQVRHVLADTATVINVPYTFTDSDYDAMCASAARDARLAWAVKHADDGQITQYLAGAPELLHRLETADAPSKALILAAMDLRRLGHRDALPLPLLEQAAQAYLTELQLDQLDEENGWEQAHIEATTLCKGAPGPLTLIRPSRTRGRQRRRSRATHDKPMYQLADYLDQYGRIHRCEMIPPLEFWIAVAAHAHPRDLFILGHAAKARGLYRDAAHLFMNATTTNDEMGAAKSLFQLLHSIQHKDLLNSAQWTVDHVGLGNLYVVAGLVRALGEAGATEQVTLLAERSATGAPIDSPRAVAALLGALGEVGATQQVTVLAERAATGTRLDLPDLVEQWTGSAYSIETSTCSLLGALGEVGATQQVTVLAERAAASVPLDNPLAVAGLVHTLAKVGTTEHVTVLAERAAASVPLDLPVAVVELLDALVQVDALAQVAVLAERAVAVVPLDNPHVVAGLVRALGKVGGMEQIAMLAERAVAGVSLDDTRTVAELLRALGWVRRDNSHHPRGVQLSQHVAVLAERAAAGAPIDDPRAVAKLLHALSMVHGVETFVEIAMLANRPATGMPLDLAKILDEIGITEQIAVLAERAAAGAPLDDSYAVTELLHALNESGATEQVAVLAERAVASAPVNIPHVVAGLVDALGEVGATEHVAKLTERAAASARPDVPDAVKELLRAPGNIDSNERITALTEGLAAAGVPLDNPHAVARLLRKLSNADATEQVAVLAKCAVAHVSLIDGYAAEILLRALGEVGATEQTMVLAQRLPAAGLFHLFMTIDDHAARFRFGLEPDTTAAIPWAWEDLEAAHNDRAD